MTTVLVVDDSTANRRLLHTLLSLRGHEVIEADSGGQALAIVRREPPEVVVADLFTPRAGGNDLIRGLREDPQTADIPVVAYGCEDTRQLDPVTQRYHVDRVVAGTSDPGTLLEAIDSLIAGDSHQPVSPIGTTGQRGQPKPTREQPAPVQRAQTDSPRPLPGETGPAGPGETGPAGAAQTAQEPQQAGWPSDGGQPFRQAVESAPVGVVLGAATGEASYINPALAQISGVPAEELLGTGWLACLSPQRQRQVIDAIAGSLPGPGNHEETLYYRDRVSRPGREPQLLDVHLRRTAGTERHPRGFLAFIIDVTATVQTEERRHAEWERHARSDSERAATRMESLRRFAGTVAHGYNNALAVILSYGEFLRDRIGEAHAQGRVDPATSHDLNTDLTSILEAGRRAAHLTQQLQSFGHRGRPPTPTVVVDLNASLQPEIAALRERLGPGVALHVNLAEGLRPVVADTAQIGEIMRNLGENALDAMPDGGELLIETAPGDPAMAPERLAAEGHVRLTVSDTGEGMPPNVAQHAIEPFFSTKPDSPGGGLGLTAVYGIASQAGGDVVIESSPDAGTSVHVLFPIAAPADARPPDAEAGAPVITETILVVDDEEPVRRLVHRILTKAGYQVLTAESTAEGLEVAQAHPGPVHCLITDLAMPGLPGTELTRRLRGKRPELAVLYMSGYAEPLLHHVGNADNRTNLLPKPFSRVELLNAVRATIHEHRVSRHR